MLKSIGSFIWYSPRRWFYILLSAIVALSVIIATPQSSRAGSWFDLILRGVQIIQLSDMSDSQELETGKQINDEIIGNGDIKLYKNADLNKYLDRIGQNIAANSDRTDIPYIFQIVNDSSINAFAIMGGYVYINTGLMTAAENEAELASVVAHEVAHISSRHSVEQVRQQAISQGILSAAGLEQSQVVQIGVSVALDLPNSRGDELEADAKGLDSLKKTGYAPLGMLSFMRKLQKEAGDSSVPTILSTHPATKDRIAALEEQIDPQTANVGDGLNKEAYRSKIKALL
jgi:beta-barrel assembly-enhancing protease